MADPKKLSKMAEPCRLSLDPEQTASLAADPARSLAQIETIKNLGGLAWPRQGQRGARSR